VSDGLEEGSSSPLGATPSRNGVTSVSSHDMPPGGSCCCSMASTTPGSRAWFASIPRSTAPAITGASSYRILGIVAAVRVRDHNQRSLPITLEGIVCVVVGLLALLRPDAGPLTWLYLVSGFAVVSGILHMAGAIQLRRHFGWVLILNGALTTLFGILMILLPLAGLLSLIWLLGAYSVFFGMLLLAVALRLRARWRATQAAAPARPDWRLVDPLVAPLPLLVAQEDVP
jgi:Short repeat of unknown function (DUF308)